MGASRVASLPENGVPAIGCQEALTHCLASRNTCEASCGVSSAVSPRNELDGCDACPYCADTCVNVSSCPSCQKKLCRLSTAKCRRSELGWFMGALTSICPGADALDSRCQLRTYTMCQLRRHNHAESAWILVGDTIYDATPYIRSHPGGKMAILRKSGGIVDCTEDMKFHSRNAQKEWRRFKVGTLCRCPRSSWIGLAMTNPVMSSVEYEFVPGKVCCIPL